MNSQLPPLDEEQIDSEALRRKNRRSFIKAGLFSVLGLLGITSLLTMEQERGLPWLLRRVNDLNDSVWKAGFREDAEIATVNADGKPFRLNGLIGLEESISEQDWSLQVMDPTYDDVLTVTMDEIRSLPATTMSFDFKCIEGWSQAIECRGVKLSDFMRAYEVGKKNQETPFEYIGLTSVNGGYYVSMDAKSFWHPQTMLCYEINGQALTPQHGAPLRLMTAVKYGVKSIKQVGKIEFANSPPKDYWAERAYQDILVF